MIKQFKTLLIFPPFWEPTSPYIALPLLTSYLKSKGYNIVQKDLNIEFFDRVLTADFLFDLLKQKKINYKPYIELIQNVNIVKPIFKTSLFYDPIKYIQGKYILEKVFELISFIYKPTFFSFRIFSMRYRFSSSIEVINATQNNKENPFIDYYNNYVIDEILDISPNLIGISIIEGTQVIPGLTLARLLKTIKPEIHITIGGTFFSKVYKSVLNNPHLFKIFFDSVVVGEGEIPLLNLIQVLDNTLTLRMDNVPSLIYLKNNKVKINQLNNSCNINQFPTPDFDDLSLDKYLVPTPILPVLASRNCYWRKCTFCDHHSTYSPRYRVRSIENVINDLEILEEKYNVSHFVFNDESITANRCKQIALKIKERGLNIYWLALSRFEKGFTLETCKKISSGGGKYLIFGLETSSPRILKLMNKGFEIDTILKTLKNTSKAGIWTYSYIFWGFPSETENEALNTIRFIIKNKNIIPSLGMGFFSLKKYSPIGYNPNKYNIRIKNPDIFEDWVTDLQFEVESGININKAKQIYQRAVNIIWEEYKGPFWLIENLRSNIFLYLTHHGIEKLKSIDLRGLVKARLLL